MSKQYLAGNLSPKENYQIEDRLLENDFCYEAFEGLEQVSWMQCQKHLEAVESRIVNEFNIDRRRGSGWKLGVGIIGIVSTLTAAWYLTTSNTGATDLTTTIRQVEMTGTPPVEDAEDLSVPDTLSKSPETNTSHKTVTVTESKNVPAGNTGTLKLQTVKTSEVAPVKPKYTETSITVGRIIDAKGLPVVNAKVRSGKVTDTTDKSGYYALKVPGGGTIVKVIHLATEYEVEIDSNQNWEIVLDIARQEVIDYHPINAANRFR